MAITRKSHSVQTVKSTLSRLNCFTGGVLLGLALGIIGLALFQGYNPPDEDKLLNPTTVFERVVEQNEMVSVSQGYCIVDKASDANSFLELFDIPFTGNSFWYRYAGTLKAGVSMRDAEMEVDGRDITVSLPQPYIIGNTVDYSKTGVLEERNNVLNPIHVEDVDEFQKACDELSCTEALKGGLLDQARESAEKNLSDMFGAAFGDEYEIRVSWREG